MQEEERQLIEAFEAYGDELFRHAFFRLSDRERAVELVQDTFLRVWEYVRKGATVRDIRPFLYRTLRNLIIDEYRRHKSYSLEAMLGEEDESIEVLLPADESNTLEAAVLRAEAARTLRAAQELPELYREVILLRYIEGLSPSEIARRIGASENVVSVRIHRALKKLRDLLGNDHE